MRRIDVNTMVDVGLAVALAAVLAFWSIYSMPQGGSVTLNMIPLIVLAVRRGPVIGFWAVCCFALQVPERTVFVHPAQVILDYPLANAVLGFAGLWVKYGRAPGDYLRNGLSVCFAMALRFLSHVIAGRIFFSEFALEQGMNEWWYSITYNAYWFGPKMVVTLILVMFLLTRREIVEVEQARA